MSEVIMTEAELFEQYLRGGWDDIMDFHTYKAKRIQAGVQLVGIENHEPYYNDDNK